MASHEQTHVNDDVELSRPDAHWPQRYEVEAAELTRVLPNDFAYRLEHFGSTAVPDLSAKPIIDILLISDDRARWPELVAPLQALGYVYWAANPRRDRMFFVKGMPPLGTGRTHHVHVYTSEAARTVLLFRDLLRANPAEAKCYETLKQQLAVRYPNDREAYTQGKTNYVQEVLSAAKP